MSKSEHIPITSLYPWTRYVLFSYFAVLSCFLCVGYLCKSPSESLNIYKMNQFAYTALKINDK